MYRPYRFHHTPFTLKIQSVNQTRAHGLNLAMLQLHASLFDTRYNPFMKSTPSAPKSRLSPLSRTLLLSLGIHTLVIGSLWLTQTDYVPEPPTPETIDTTILPPPEVTPDDTATTSAPAVVKTPPVKEPTLPSKAAAKGTSNVVKNTEGNNQSDKGKVESEGANDHAPVGQTKGKDTEGNNPVTPPITPTTAAKEAPNGVPIAVKTLNSGYVVQYEASVDYITNGIGGSGKLIYNRTGDNTYTASLTAKAMGFGIEAKSTGEIRKDSLATTRFENKKIRPIGSARVNTFAASYPTQEIHFGSGGVQPLPYNTLYDFVSAIIYIQSVLQSGKTSGSFTINVARSSTIAPMIVQLGSMAIAKTDDGDFDAIPVSMNVQNSAIDTIKVWFVPEKQYRPLRIEVSLAGEKGKIVLVSRNSPN